MEPTRKPVSMTLLSAAATAGMLTIGVVSSGKTSAPMYPFAEQIIVRDLCCKKCDILNQPIDARRSIEAWRIHYNQVRPHSAGRYISPEQFGLAGQTGYGKAVPRPTISLDSDLREYMRSYKRGGSGYVQRKEWSSWGREGSP